MTRKLPQCYPADISAALQLSDVLGHRIVQTELTLFNSLREQCGREHLANRSKIKDRVGRDLPILRIVSKAVVKELRLTIHPHGDRNPSSLAVLRQYRLNLLPDDLFNVDLSTCRSSN